MSSNPHPFAQLSPELVIDAVESTGRLSDLRVFALNSYENRVYQIGIEPSISEKGEPLIVKFYRPERWSDAQILEEHRFSQQLVDAELPVVAPLRDDNGETLFRFGDFRFSFFPRRGGQAPDLDNPDNQLMLGRQLARMHAIGATENYQARPALDIKTFGYDSYHFVAEHCLSGDLLRAYSSLCEDLLKRIEKLFDDIQPKLIRTHSDCHVGNILSRDQQCLFVDLDDSRMTPAIQDLWMLQSGERHERIAQLAELIEGYGEFFDFDYRELSLIEALRTLRLMHFSAWLARRWQDPAFPLGFPWFGSERYWADHILELREQLFALNEPPLRLF
ncbi:MAG: stress response serine/threonine protein kinase YihE [Verrucomicrobiaceae bacterium]|nr:stress response serine/threonine protein kinase YihE [Verrucomicrobiaceae bacterium]